MRSYELILTCNWFNLATQTLSEKLITPVCQKPPIMTYATPRSSALLLVYQSSHPGMTDIGESTALPQSTTNDRVSKKICHVYMNLFTKMIYNEKTLPFGSK